MTYSVKFFPRSALESSTHRLHTASPKQILEAAVSRVFVSCCVDSAVYKWQQSLPIKCRKLPSQRFRPGYTSPPPPPSHSRSVLPHLLFISEIKRLSLVLNIEARLITTVFK